MQSLTVLDLSRCYRFSSFPKFTGIMKSLSILKLPWTDIEKVEPSSIECLPALTFLDLNGCTNLECLPSNMGNLRSLEILNLSRTFELFRFPRRPSNVICMKAEGSSSPECVKQSIWSQRLSRWRRFNGRCSRVAFSMLFHFLRGLLFHKAVLGGYIIRSWSAVKEGFSINIKLPSNWYNSKWIGFALWASLPQLPRYLQVKDGIRARVNNCAFGHYTTYISGICLLYLSREDWFHTVGNDECSQITVIFENRYSTAHICNECGVSFIYKQGVVRVDELNETNAPCFIESFGEVCIYKLTGGDEDAHIVDDDDAHIVDDDDAHIVYDDDAFIGFDAGAHIVDGDDAHIFNDDDFDDADIE